MKYNAREKLLEAVLDYLNKKKVPLDKRYANRTETMISTALNYRQEKYYALYIILESDYCKEVKNVPKSISNGIKKIIKTFRGKFDEILVPPRIFPENSDFPNTLYIEFIPTSYMKKSVEMN